MSDKDKSGIAKLYPGTGGHPDAGTKPPGTDAGTKPPGTDAGTGGVCSSRETEPNDARTAADKLEGTVCGDLEAKNEDWYTWTANAAGIDYTIRLGGNGDAVMSMWKLVDGEAADPKGPERAHETNQGEHKFTSAVFHKCRIPDRAAPSVHVDAYSLTGSQEPRSPLS